MTTELIVAAAPAVLPARLFAPTPKAAKRELEFFTAQINNDHTRKAYLNSVRRFAAWCETKGLNELCEVEPYHVAAFTQGRRGWVRLHEKGGKEHVPPALPATPKPRCSAQPGGRPARRRRCGSRTCTA
jgi:hypothetical protein